MAVTHLIEIETCFECLGDLKHCHGTAIVHGWSSFDCTDDPDCPIPADLHLFVVACEDECCSLEP